MPGKILGVAALIVFMGVAIYGWVDYLMKRKNKKQNNSGITENTIQDLYVSDVKEDAEKERKEL